MLIWEFIVFQRIELKVRKTLTPSNSVRKAMENTLNTYNQTSRL
jgi:hypothetical protein